MAGYVTLVGAGCGPDLITVRGLKAVQHADIILYDDLIPDGILKEAKPGAALFYVGKRAGQPYQKQEETTELLIRLAKESKQEIQIVRLKGGDGFVFGRGGEEMLALRGAGIPCEIIPGVSSAIAVPEEFGIPVTHRGTARSFTVITGHTAACKAAVESGGAPGEAANEDMTQPSEDYAALASLNGTLVFLMGLKAVPEIARRLMENGKAGDTPAAILMRGFAPDAERISGTLATIGALSGRAKTPAVLVIGATAAMHLESTVRRPLAGVRVTVTGTESMTARLYELLSHAGAEVIREQNLSIIPQPENLPEDITDAQWIVFTSPNGVRIFFDTFRSRGGDVRQLSQLRFAVIGPGTARKLAEYGIRADFMPEEYSSRALGTALTEKLKKDEKVYILRAAGGAAALTDALRKADISYKDCGIYRTQTVGQERIAEAAGVKEPADAEKKGREYLVFSSASGVRAYLEKGKPLPPGTVPVCIGPSTADELRRFTDAPFLTAEPYTAEGILNTLIHA